MASAPAPSYDRYYRYDELTGFLTGWAGARSDLLRLEQIGESYEGRPIWLAVVTAFASGEDRDKPAAWIDGNIHSVELAPSSACLYLIDTLLRGYGADADITRCLDTRAFYICPRLNPDGAELALADSPRFLRSSTRPWPHADDPPRGLVPGDVDGDGRVLSMRIRDPSGPYKPLETDPRVMVRRDPTEMGGEYYRVFWEGTAEGYDGHTLPAPVDSHGIDLNRNFPASWRLEAEQKGAGPYPSSEPEVRAAVSFLSAHRNVVSAFSLHTFGGLLLRPYSDRPDEEMAAEDLWAYKRIGREGEALTGYRPLSVYHDFRYHPSSVITGAFDDWVYDHLGAFAWTVEIWSPQRQAGIETHHPIEWYRDHPVSDDLKLMAWNDRVLGGAAFEPWRPFDHPQLGPVEIGGWDSLMAWRNPPPPLLEAEIARFPRWFVWNLLLSPRLVVAATEVERLGLGSYLVRAVVQNEGWLPTYVTKRALTQKLVRPVIAELELQADGARIAAGPASREIGHLEGRANGHAAGFAWSDKGTPDRALVEWTVSAPEGSTAVVTARHERGGVVRECVTLGE